MNISIEQKKAEAIRRMKKIGIFNQTIKQFDKEGLVSISEPPLGAFYWADKEDIRRIREFEEEYNGLVYVVIRSWVSICGEEMQLDSFLYVSDYEEEWETDREDLSDGYATAYVYNRTHPEFSEIGGVAFQLTPAGGLIRVF